MRRILAVITVGTLLVSSFISCDKKEKTNPYYDPNWREKENPVDPDNDDPEDPKVLYNGIKLPDVWPPQGYMPNSKTPIECPYLKDSHPAVVPVNVGRQLFVDDFLIEFTTLKRIFYKARKWTGNPLLRASNSLEIPSSGFSGLGPKDGGIWWDPDENVFKMWYEAGWLNKMAYATSADGKNWTKPVLYDGLNEIHCLSDLKPNSCAVVLDYQATDGYKYKMFFRQPNDKVPGMTGVAMVSKDGINWTNRTTTGYCGDRTTMFYNPFRKKWVFSLRSERHIGSEAYGRTRYYTENSDFLKGAAWRPSDVVFWCGTDNLDKADPDINIAPQLYNLQAVAYESIMLSYIQILVDENDVAMNAGRPKVTNLQLGYSRDGFHWYRPDREPFIASSKTLGLWDRGYVQSVGNVCSVFGDNLVFWYIGFAGVDNRPGHSASLHSNMATGVATLRRDGFCSMAGSGTLTTVPVSFDGSYLFVNINCPTSEFTAEVLDEKGNVIDGFEKAKCKSLRTDSTIALVEWEGKSDLSELKGKPVKFRFNLSGGEIYSFWVSPSVDGESRGYVAGGGPGYTSNVDDKGIKSYTAGNAAFKFEN